MLPFFVIVNSCAKRGLESFKYDKSFETITRLSIYIPMIIKKYVSAYNIKICVRGTLNISNVQKMSIEVGIPHMKDLLGPIK
jgi:hypothetical protein